LRMTAASASMPVQCDADSQAMSIASPSIPATTRAASNQSVRGGLGCHLQSPCAASESTSTSAGRRRRGKADGSVIVTISAIRRVLHRQPSASAQPSYHSIQ
jgi:hypothetical protein